MVASSIIIIVLVVSTVIATSIIVLLTIRCSLVLTWNPLVSKVRAPYRSELRLHLLLIGLLGHHHLRKSLHRHVGISIEWSGSKLSRIVNLLRHTHIHILAPKHLLLNQACSNIRVVHVASNWHRLRLNRLLKLSLVFLIVFFLYTHVRR